MKNVDKLYEKYCNFYKNDFDNDDEKKKKKKIDCKQLELFDKTDKKLTLDEETKNFFKDIKDQEKIVNKKKFREYFSDEPTALVNKLLSQNTQDLRKSLNEIKQQKIKLNEDERNSRSNKNENDNLNNILSAIDKTYQLFEYNFFWGKQRDELKLPKWVKVSAERFNEILSTVTKAKNEGLKVNVDGKRLC